MLANEIRRKYIEFFKSKGHAEIPSASLIPENDPTVLFTTAGMHPLVPYLMGEKHPLGKRLVDCQKSLRTDDIDEVGDLTHCTFFEMMGNWSLGDYFKEGAIKMSYEFLTSKEYGLGLDPKYLSVSCFEGDKDAPKDMESFEIWKSLGIPENRIAFLPKKDNWWGPAGQTGPCGPDSEMFYWTGEEKPPSSFDPKDKKWVEIWNDVFMQYNKKADGTFEPLKQQNVDTGLGLERVTAVLQGKKSHYETELFLPAIQEINKLKKIEEPKSERIIADHLRSSTFVLGDEKGIAPSNTDQGYILRRLIRRAVREGRKIGIEGNFTHKIAEIFINIYKEIYPELLKNKNFILEQLKKEEDKFHKTLINGEKEFEQELKTLGLFDVGEWDTAEWDKYKFSGKVAFKLYETYGYPIEEIKEKLREVSPSNPIEVNMEEFNEAYKKHQELSRQGALQKFKGGLADHSEQTTKLHTATHLLQASLRKVLGDHVAQKGSNITVERLRFDFSHPEKMTLEQLKKVEELINEAIQSNLPVNMEEMTVEEAKNQGAIGLFASKYSEKVKVYTVGKSKTDFFSKEICGGPHVANTSELRHFKILKEEASSAGVRRIKAVIGE